MTNNVRTAEIAGGADSVTIFVLFFQWMSFLTLLFTFKWVTVLAFSLPKTTIDQNSMEQYYNWETSPTVPSGGGRMAMPVHSTRTFRHYIRQVHIDLQQSSLRHIEVSDVALILYKHLSHLQQWLLVDEVWFFAKPYRLHDHAGSFSQGFWE